VTNDIIFERQDKVGVVTLDRPNALNALTLPMITALQEQLVQWQDDKDIHVVVVQAKPGKAFCAGGDVRWLYETGQSDPALQQQFFWHEYRLNYFIHRYQKPYIALMDGMTMGGGVGISLHGAYPIVSPRFYFAMPETTIGFFPDIGASFLLSRSPGQLGLYLALTGEYLGARDALNAGLVRFIIDSDKMSEVVPKLRELELSSHARMQINHCLNSLATKNRDSLTTCDLDKINSFFDKNSVQAIMEGLEISDDPWAFITLTTLQKKSPLSLEVTFAQMKRAKSMTMAQCLQMDYGLVRHFMQGSDFYEGVRAALIDKDKNPTWQLPHLRDVNPAEIARYFENEGQALGFI
jgi:enoyl-CoA hydratase